MRPRSPIPVKIATGLGLTVILFCLFSSQVFALPKTPVAVYDPVVAQNTRSPKSHKLDLNDLRRQLEGSLRDTGQFSVLTRESAAIGNAVSKEIRLNASVASDQALKREIKTAPLVIQPIVVSYSAGTHLGAIDGLPGKYRRYGYGKLRVTYEIIDSETLEKHFQTTQKVSFKGKSDVVTGKTYLSVRPIWRHMVDKATRAAVGELAQAAARVTESILPIKVLKVAGDQIYLNRGKGSGLKPGQVLELMSVGEALVDPDTGESLGAAEFLIGKVKIVRMLPKYSVARAHGELQDQVRRGDILRRIAP